MCRVLVETMWSMVVEPVISLERRCQYKFFAFVYPYGSVKNMGCCGSPFFGGGGGEAPVLKLDKCQGLVTNAKISVHVWGGVCCRLARVSWLQVDHKTTRLAGVSGLKSYEVSKAYSCCQWAFTSQRLTNLVLWRKNTIIKIHRPMCETKKLLIYITRRRAPSL